MQNTIRLSLVLLFLFITVKSHSSIAPSPTPLWPTAESLLSERVSLKNDYILSMSNEELKERLHRISQIFPKREIQTAQRSRDLPKYLLESGHQLRELQRISQMRPNFSQDVLSFFKNCSKDKKILSTLNSVCLSHALKLSESEGEELSLDEYSPKTVKLAKLGL